MSKNLLICTVGGAPEPIVASILAHRPERVLFVASTETKGSVDERIVPSLADHEMQFALDAGRFDFFILPNAQDFSACVSELRTVHTRYVQPWIQRGTDFKVIVDFTGGTKCMTAALALSARRWDCTFSYVGGTERSKDGVGIVISGREQIIHNANPWAAFGFDAADQAVLLFNHGDLTAAARILDHAKRQAGETVKRGLNTLQQLCEAYDLWDRFQHQNARTRLQNVLRAPNDLHAWFPASASQLIRTIEQHVTTLSRLPGDSDSFLRDLLANAERCAKCGRFDDAVGRLYRVCEAAAQFRLKEIGLSDSSDGKVVFDRIPESLRAEFEHRQEDAVVRMGLQDDYAILGAVDDPLGRTFVELGLNDREESPLNDRNSSILAHGQSPLSEKGYQKLLAPLLKLLDIQPDDLCRFPVLSA